MFDHDVCWRVRGDNPMTGEYKGWRQVVRFLRRTTEETHGVRPGSERGQTPQTGMERIRDECVSLSLRLLEQRLPLLEQGLQAVAGSLVRGERLDVGPVLGELRLELGDLALARGDLRLD